MRQLLRVLGCFLWIILTFGVCAEAAQSTPIVSEGEITTVGSGFRVYTIPPEKPIFQKGETTIIASSTKTTIRVRIKTHEVQINEKEKKTNVCSACTYTRNPCSVVDDVSITVNAAQIFVPRAAFCDLADLNVGEIEIKQDKYILRFTAGDASEAYIVRIEFDNSRVKRKYILDEENPDVILQETIYYEVIQ